MYAVAWKRSAVKELRALPVEARVCVADAVGRLSGDPHPPGVRKLTGTSHTYRLRVGDDRVVYTVESGRLLVEVVRVGHRREVYRR